MPGTDTMAATNERLAALLEALREDVKGLQLGQSQIADKVEQLAHQLSRR